MPQLSATTEVLLDRELVVYRRERSNVWQCRYKVDGKWQRATTSERDITKAKVKAKDLMIEAEIRKRSNLPVITRKFRNVAKLALDRMDKIKRDCKGIGRGIASFADYESVINKYLIEYFGNKSITSIDHAELNAFDEWRTKKMGKAPSQSTVQTHNAALNRVFDEAVIRNFLTDANRPKLEAKGRVSSNRRAAFTLAEVKAMIAAFEGWIDRANDENIKETRLLMRDYILALLDTGARPGKELLNLKWNQIRVEETKFEHLPTDQFEEDGEQIIDANIQRSVSMPVKGKTGEHTILGMHSTVEALIRIAKRNYDEKTPVFNPLKNIIKPSNSGDSITKERTQLMREVLVANAHKCETIKYDGEFLQWASKVGGDATKEKSESEPTFAHFIGYEGMPGEYYIVAANDFGKNFEDVILRKMSSGLPEDMVKLRAGVKRMQEERATWIEEKRSLENSVQKVQKTVPKALENKKNKPK